MQRRNDFLAALAASAVSAGVDGSVVLVAVSGGPDSLALLHALYTLRGELGISELAVAHFDHGLRAEQSAAEAAFVNEFSHSLGLKCFVEAAAPGSIASTNRGSLQESARDARYRFLDRIADDIGARFIATAHHRDDQVETILINILRGTGIDGLRGIPRQNGRYIRPLLDVDRAAIEAYCAEHTLTPRREPTNDDPSHYLRNRIRLELLPLLERDYHPAVRDSLLRLSDIAAVESAYLDEAARSALADISVVRRPKASPPHPVDTGLVLDIPRLLAQPIALQRRIVRLAVQSARGTTDGLSEAHVLAALHMAEHGGSGITVPSPELRIHRNASTKSLAFEMDETGHDTPASTTLSIGKPVQWVDGWTLRVDTARPILTTSTQWIEQIDANRIDLDTLTVRSWLDGDQIAPLGMSGKTKKLQDIFADAHIPRPWRRRWPIVVDGDGVVWMPGLCLSDRVRMRESTTRPVCLSAYGNEMNERWYRA